MDLVGDLEFESYKSLMRDAHDTFERKSIIWLKSVVRIDRYQEDITNPYVPTTIDVQCVYNFMRTWPLTLTSESGELDKQSIQIFVNKQYLDELGYINSDGYWDYNPDMDRFLIDGLLYKAVGDTPVAQAGPNDILISFLVKREETPTGDKR